MDESVMKRQMAPIKREPAASQEDTTTTGTPTMNGNAVDYNKLYGDLCKKLLSTPVEEIFPSVISGIPTSTTSGMTGNTSQTPLHPAFPTFGNMAAPQMAFLPQFYSPSPLMSTHLPANYVVPSPILVKQELSLKKSGSPKDDSPDKDLPAICTSSPSDIEIENSEPIDVQKLVDEFRVTLERYGVSQRFAARFIMQDTSQGNLSFLMEKGRNKKWDELSPRGRLPYIKMKAWLESKEQQMMTLEMLKHSQEAKRNSPREPYSRRERFSMFQLNFLCRLFEENPNPPMNVRNAVAEQLDISLDRVNVWFQNQRARGFPARKVLQQTLYERGFSPQTALEIETMKRSISSSSTSPNSLSPTSSTTVQPVCKKERSPINSMTEGMNFQATNGSTSTNCFSSGFVPPTLNATKSPLPSPRSCSSGLESPSLSEDALPLDLSTSSNQSSQNLVTKDPEQNSNELTNYSKESSQYRSSAYQNNSAMITHSEAVPTNMSNKTTASGAAKRKRGCKPQQIIPTSKTDEKITENVTVKRRRLSDDNNKRADDNRLTDSDRYQTSQLDDSNKEYQYVLDIGSPVSKLKSCMNENGNRKESSDVQPTRENINKAESKTSEQNVELFQAVCAKLVNSGDKSLVEPDLD